MFCWEVISGDAIFLCILGNFGSFYPHSRWENQNLKKQQQKPLRDYKFKVVYQNLWLLHVSLGLYRLWCAISHLAPFFKLFTSVTSVEIKILQKLKKFLLGMLSLRLRTKYDYWMFWGEVFASDASIFDFGHVLTFLPL